MIQDYIHPSSVETTDHDSIALTQADLDRGLTAEQIEWLRTHLNIKPLARALRDIERRNVQEGQTHDR